jgi:hypothetical protein
MITANLKPTGGRDGPYCAALNTGSVLAVDGRSKAGRFTRKCEAELTAQIGGSPSFAQRILIRRVVRALWALEALDAKMASGSWTDHDSRTHGGLGNQVRLSLRELGIKPAADKPPSLAQYLADRQETAAP